MTNWLYETARALHNLGLGVGFGKEFTLHDLDRMDGYGPMLIWEWNWSCFDQSLCEKIN